VARNRNLRLDEEVEHRLSRRDHPAPAPSPTETME
jgi:hypothetical protein